MLIILVEKFTKFVDFIIIFSLFPLIPDEHIIFFFLSKITLFLGEGKPPSTPPIFYFPFAEVLFPPLVHSLISFTRVLS